MEGNEVVTQVVVDRSRVLGPAGSTPLPSNNGQFCQLLTLQDFPHRVKGYGITLRDTLTNLLVRNPLFPGDAGVGGWEEVLE